LSPGLALVGAALVAAAAATQAAATPAAHPQPAVHVPPDAQPWLPPGAHATPLLEGRIDGQGARILALGAPTDCPSLLLAVRAAWLASAGPPPVDGRAGPWLTLSALREEGLRVLQVRASPAGACAGLFTLWPAPAEHPPSADPPGWPAAVRVLRRLESRETGQRELTVLATTTLPPVQALASLERFLAPAGLRLRPAASARLAGAGSAGRAYAASAPGAQASLYLEPRDGATNLILIIQGERP
jgi:hypothetical protein